LRISAVGFAPILAPISLTSDDKTQGFIDLRLNAMAFDGTGGMFSDKGKGVK
jgi:hypothetical protein